jgi:hypothetical protein
VDLFLFVVNLNQIFIHLNLGANDKELYKRIIKGQFTIPDYVSPLARGLLKRILTVDPDKRPKASQIKRDQWLSEIESPTKGRSLSLEGIKAQNVNKNAENETTTTEKKEDKVFEQEQKKESSPESRKKKFNLEAYMAYYNTKLERLEKNITNYPQAHPEVDFSKTANLHLKKYSSNPNQLHETATPKGRKSANPTGYIGPYTAVTEGKEKVLKINMKSNGSSNCTQPTSEITSPEMSNRTIIPNPSNQNSNTTTWRKLSSQLHMQQIPNMNNQNPINNSNNRNTNDSAPNSNYNTNRKKQTRKDIDPHFSQGNTSPLNLSGLKNIQGINGLNGCLEDQLAFNCGNRANTINNNFNIVNNITHICDNTNTSTNNPNSHSNTPMFTKYQNLLSQNPKSNFKAHPSNTGLLPNTREDEIMTHAQTSPINSQNMDHELINSIVILHNPPILIHSLTH